MFSCNELLHIGIPLVGVLFDPFLFVTEIFFHGRDIFANKGLIVLWS